MGTRAQAVHESLFVLDRGGPPLLGPAKARLGTRSPELGCCFKNVYSYDYNPIPYGDTPGIYLYLPVLAHWFHKTDPLPFLKWLFISTWLLIPLAYPLVFYELFRSVVIGLIAPFLPLMTFGFVENSDVYWASAWAILLCLPLIML